jgi:transposase InsO family protein
LPRGASTSITGSRPARASSRATSCAGPRPPAPTAPAAEGDRPLHDAGELRRSRVSDMLMRRGATVDVRLPAIHGRLDRLRGFGDVAALSRPADADRTRRTRLAASASGGRPDRSGRPVS